MQILHPFLGSLQQYAEAISDPDRYRPDHCPQCQAQQPLVGHGFYSRTLVAGAWDSVIQVRRFQQQAPALCAALAAKITPLPAAKFVTRALLMLQSLGGIAVHRFLFSELRMHLLGWPRFLAPHGRLAMLPSTSPP